MLQTSTLLFLKQLAKNNNKPWFDANRKKYDEARKDFENFIQSLITEFGKKDPSIASLPAKQCLFRINRDIRFSKDKTPYKKNFAASINKGGKKSSWQAITSILNRAIVLPAEVYGCLCLRRRRRYGRR